MHLFLFFSSSYCPPFRNSSARTRTLVTYFSSIKSETEHWTKPRRLFKRTQLHCVCCPKSNAPFQTSGLTTQLPSWRPSAFLLFAAFIGSEKRTGSETRCDKQGVHHANTTKNIPAAEGVQFRQRPNDRTDTGTDVLSDTCGAHTFS